MNEIRINEKISYIPASDDPLSADIGIIRDCGAVWLYDVGSDETRIAGLQGTCHVVLSHFHQDHTGNIDRIPAKAIYASKMTCDHIHRGTVVAEELVIGSVHIFPLPSSHTKGCLGLEVDEAYAFVGDALYSKVRDGHYIFNATLLKDEIDVLKQLKAPYLLVSHFPGLVRPRAEVIAELEALYASREKDDPEIRIPIA